MSTNSNVNKKTDSTDIISDQGPDPSSDMYPFLATVNVQALTKDGNYVVLRALLDGECQLG